MVLSLRNLEETRSFYKVELKKEDLTERERDKYSRALKLIDGLIKRKEKAGEKSNLHYSKEKFIIGVGDKKNIAERH